MFTRGLKAGTALATLAVVFGVQAQVKAADYVPPPPPPAVPDIRPSVVDWSGGYAGFHVGWQFFDAEYTEIPGIDPLVKGDGFLGGGLIGYNFQDDSFVYGIELDFSFGDVEGFDDSNKFDPQMQSTIRGRLGYAWGNGLYYATGGLGLVDMDIQSDTFGGKDDRKLFGVVAGAGAEWQFGRDLSFRAEYLYGFYDTHVFNFGTGAVITGMDNVHTARAALVFNMRPDG